VLNNLKRVIQLRRFLIVFILLSLCGTSSAQQGPNLPPKYVDGIMAVIGEKIIRRSDFETEKMDMARGQILKDSHLLYCLLFEKLIRREDKRRFQSVAARDGLPQAPN
jgi:Zn-dependent protease